MMGIEHMAKLATNRVRDVYEVYPTHIVRAVIRKRRWHRRRAAVLIFVLDMVMRAYAPIARWRRG